MEVSKAFDRSKKTAVMSIYFFYLDIYAKLLWWKSRLLGCQTDLLSDTKDYNSLLKAEIVVKWGDNYLMVVGSPDTGVILDLFQSSVPEVCDGTMASIVPFSMVLEGPLAVFLGRDDIKS